jgi:hypothetical protein
MQWNGVFGGGTKGGGQMPAWAVDYSLKRVTDS